MRTIFKMRAKTQFTPYSTFNLNHTIIYNNYYYYYYYLLLNLPHPFLRTKSTLHL